MLHDGPVPYLVHGLLDYVLGAFLIASPFIFGFSNRGAPTALGIVAGIAVLVLAGSTDGRTSLTNGVPLPLHIVADLLLGALFIAAPFIFGFSDVAAPTGLFIGLGVLEFLLFVATGFPREERRLRT